MDLVRSDFFAVAQKSSRPCLAVSPAGETRLRPSNPTRELRRQLAPLRSFRYAQMRRGWDLNPRGAFAPAGFRNQCIRPLCHLSNPDILAFQPGNDKFCIRPHRLTARTAPFHGVNRGSIPRGVMGKKKVAARGRYFLLPT